MTDLPRFSPLPVPPDPAEAPSPYAHRDEPVTYHGLDPLERTAAAPWRRVVLVPGRTWPCARPEECVDYSGTGEWVAGTVLVCPSCGLDCT